MINAVQLITYVDRLSHGGLGDLKALLQGPLQGLFGGVHLLPFFHPIDGADAGFDPIDHTRVDHRLGNWAEVKDLSQDVEIMADIIINHVSADSPQFQDMLARGAESPYHDMFLTLGKVFPKGATEADLLTLHSTRPSLPFTIFRLATGELRLLWTSFTSQQIDIDVFSEAGSAYLYKILDTFARAGITLVRLDAAGYAVKRAGTRCFMIPDSIEFITRFTQAAHLRGVEVLVEVHGHFLQQLQISRTVDRVYDFALPPLVLHTLYTGDATALKHWLEISPRNALTVLDTHDGIGVADVDEDSEGRPGLLSSNQVRFLIEEIHRRSGETSRKASGPAAKNIDELQVNCTFFDALGQNERLYLIARAIQFFAPGIPQVYYVGLLAGKNDMELLHRTGVGRDINRHYYNPEEIKAEISRPVVQGLFDLIRFRNKHPAFQGLFGLCPTSPDTLSLRWEKGEQFAQLDVDLNRTTARVRFSDTRGEQALSVLARVESHR